MEIRDTAGLVNRAKSIGDRATSTPLYPPSPASPGFLAVDLWRVEPGGSVSPEADAGEQVLYVLGGRASLTGMGESPTSVLHDGSVIVISPYEEFVLRNTGQGPLTVLVSTPMVGWSRRVLGLPAEGKGHATGAAPPASQPLTSTVGPRAPEGAPVSAHEPPEDISKLMRRASELQSVARPERRRPAPESEAAAQEEAAQEEEEEEAPSSALDLLVVFEGRIRGDRAGTGQGYGRYSVQSPGRNPVVKTAEFGEGFTRELAEYETLVECLQYIIQRLTVTNRSPAQVQLDISSSNDAIVQQLTDEPRIRDQALRRKYDQAIALLGEFAEWQLTLHSPEESAAALRFQ